MSSSDEAALKRDEAADRRDAAADGRDLLTAIRHGAQHGQACQAERNAGGRASGSASQDRAAARADREAARVDREAARAKAGPVGEQPR